MRKKPAEATIWSTFNVYAEGCASEFIYDFMAKQKIWNKGKNVPIPLDDHLSDQLTIVKVFWQNFQDSQQVITQILVNNQ